MRKLTIGLAGIAASPSAVMPALARDASSPASVTPSWSKSRQTRRLAKPKSLKIPASSRNINPNIFNPDLIVENNPI
jgi:hypothetical protein